MHQVPTVSKVPKSESSKTRLKPQVARLQSPRPPLPHGVTFLIAVYTKHRRRGKLNWVFLPAEASRSAFLVDGLKVLWALTCTHRHPLPKLPPWGRWGGLSVWFKVSSRGCSWLRYHLLGFIQLQSCGHEGVYFGYHTFSELSPRQAAGQILCKITSILWEWLPHVSFESQFKRMNGRERGRGMHGVIRMARKGGRKKVRCEGLKRPRYWVTFHFPRCHASPRVHVFTFAEPFVWKDLPKSLVYLEISDMETTSPPSTPWSFPDCLLLRPVNF